MLSITFPDADSIHWLLIKFLNVLVSTVVFIIELSFKLKCWSNTPNSKVMLFQDFCFCQFAICDSLNLLHNTSADFSDSLFTVYDGSGIKIHVFVHALEHWCICRDFYHRGNRRSGRCSASACE